LNKQIKLISAFKICDFEKKSNITSKISQLDLRYIFHLLLKKKKKRKKLHFHIFKQKEQFFFQGHKRTHIYPIMSINSSGWTDQLLQRQPKTANEYHLLQGSDSCTLCAQ